MCNRLKLFLPTLNSVEKPKRWEGRRKVSWSRCAHFLKWQVLSQLSSSMGIIVSIQSDLSNGQQRDMIGHSESDIEFSSDCLPIKTSSSSSVDLSSFSAGGDDGLDGDGRTAVVIQGESVLDGAQEAPMSPLTEIPPTPTLTNTHEQSESEVEEQEMEGSIRTKNTVDEIALNGAKRLNAHPAGPRHRNIDPVSD